MNYHIFLDNLTATVAGIVAGRKKFFAKSLDSLSFFDLIRSVETHFPPIGKEGIHELVAKTPAGNIDPAFKIEKWLGYDYPTIIYHHGNNERPFDFRKGAKNTFLNIFVNSRDEKVVSKC